MSTFTLPFNFRPTATYQFTGSGSTYTVPAGKHAYISASLMANCEVQGIISHGGSTFWTNYESKCCVADSQNFWIKPADVITVSIPADTTSGITVNIGIPQTLDFTVQLLINGVAAMTVRAVALASYSVGAASTNMVVLKAGSISFAVAEYDPAAG